MNVTELKLVGDPSGQQVVINDYGFAIYVMTSVITNSRKPAANTHVATTQKLC